MLRAVVKDGSSVETFVYKLSMAALMSGNHNPSKDRAYHSDDWNTLSYDDGVKGDGLTADLVSKMEAEKVAFRFIEVEKP